MRAVLDTNVLIASLLSADGSPGRLLVAWRSGAFELVVSAALLAELRRALAYPRIADRVSEADAAAFVSLLERSATVVVDSPEGSLSVRPPDSGDAFVVALAMHSRSHLVTGDRGLQSLASALPIHSPAEFMRLLET